ncbi:hypothetical protein NDU88_002519 [Pleurodeles waltl]|uniref:Uncharacterized protein n=1 Tax=Pleurodeles waltl TaxID=8319 RepID=A0AAV7VAR5_PLEWA|nr:hypothetical protein NDU88_002519 [Pleurodeles waltl]
MEKKCTVTPSSAKEYPLQEPTRHREVNLLRALVASVIIGFRFGRRSCRARSKRSLDSFAPAGPYSYFLFFLGALLSL